MDEKKNVTSPWWLAIPANVEPKVLEWQEKYPNRLDICYKTQYTGHRIYALTLTDKNISDDSKKRLLTIVSHGHEPAGSAAIMNYINQLLTGKHLDDRETDLDSDKILSRMLLTFIPIGNPDGRSRAPVDCWDGSIYDADKFFDYMKGLRTGGSRFDWPEPRVWRKSAENVTQVGITFAQIDEDTYAEPFWGPEVTKYNELMEQLAQTRHYDALLDLHQTYEREERYDTFVQYVAENWMPKEFQDYAAGWSADAEAAFEKVGAHFSGIHHGGDRRWIINQFTLKHGTPNLLFEVQNNHPNTPMDEQLLYSETMIRVSVERLC